MTQPGLKSHKIMIVDDDPTTLESIRATLLTEGYELMAVSKARETVAKAVQFLPDIILLDVMMPELNGLEVCKQIRLTPEIKDTVVILLTALDDRADRLRGMEAGADDFVSKPYDRLELRARIRTICRLNRFRRLMEQEHSLEWSLEHSRDGRGMIDVSGTLIYANAITRELLGFDANAPLPAIPLDHEITSRFAVIPATPTRPHTTTRLLCRKASVGTPSQWVQIHELAPSGQTGSQRLIQVDDVTLPVVSLLSTASMLVIIRRLAHAGMHRLLHDPAPRSASPPPTSIERLCSLMTQIDPTLPVADVFNVISSSHQGIQIDMTAVPPEMRISDPTLILATVSVLCYAMLGRDPSTTVSLIVGPGNAGATLDIRFTPPITREDISWATEPVAIESWMHRSSFHDFMAYKDQGTFLRLAVAHLRGTVQAGGTEPGDASLTLRLPMPVQ